MTSRPRGRRTSDLSGVLLRLVPIAIAAAAPCVADAQQSATAGEPYSLGRIEARLFYEGTGRLSDNIAAPAEFNAWNTSWGGGAAEEPADDMLVQVEILTARAEDSVPGSLRIEVRNSKGRLLAGRTFRYIYTSEQGRSYRALFVKGIGCAGELKITARLGALVRATEVKLPCGE